MRHAHLSITPRRIHGLARQYLQACLDWQPFRRSVSVTQLLDLLLLVAATGASLFAVARRFFRPYFSHETARHALDANLPDINRLTQGLLHALHDVLSFDRRDRRRRWTVAIDVHAVPYYGQKGVYVVGGPRKAGTKYSFSYATATLLHKGRRYTVALMPVNKHKPHEIVATLLGQIAEKGLQVRGVALDSAFDSGATLLLLQERGLAYAVPLRRKGKGSNRRNQCFEGRSGTVRWVEWVTEDSRRVVRTRVVLWRRRGKAARAMALAFDGWTSGQAAAVRRQARQARRKYRDRFGIETSYRQKNQAQGKTTSRDPVYRLLLEGLGHLLRQVWVRLAEELARAGRLRPGEWVSELPFVRLLEWLADLLRSSYPESHSIPTDTYDYNAASPR